MKCSRMQLLIGGLLLLHACGKSNDTKTETAKGEPAAATQPSVSIENAPFAATIKARGYRVVHAKRFPAQLAARRGTVVVYQAGDGKSGGVLYAQSMPSGPDLVSWHWLFRDGAPDSVQALELNDDGLWDVRVFMKGGKTQDFVQGRAFTFMGPERDGLVALNGDSSAPADLWKCFDGDTATVWQSPAGGAFIDVPNPFGLSKGELTVRLAEKDRPTKIGLVAGAATQSLELTGTSAEQRFKLDPAVTSASSIRLEIQGSGANVAISELEFR
jgi:hypothetical protein